jgi:hypothetical protein
MAILNRPGLAGRLDVGQARARRGVTAPMLAGLIGLLVAACGGGGDAPTPGTATAENPGAVAQPATPDSSQSGSGAATALPTLPAGPLGTARTQGLVFSFALPSARTTSAGVYATDGHLVRTLWRGERLNAGAYTRTWDQRRDDGTPAPGGFYTVRLIHHDLGYEWEGVVGNTSFGASVGLPHRAYLPPASLAIDGEQLHFGVGYNEAQTAIQGLDMRQPQQPASRVTHIDPFVGVGLIASDGSRLYAANTGGLTTASFVFAYELASGRQAAFVEGRPLCLNRRPNGVDCYPQQTYVSVIAQRAASQAPVTGLAVQRSGRVLAVAYGADNLVVLYDKTLGRRIGEIGVPLGAQSANQLAISATGDLWVVSGNTVLRYTDLEILPRLVLTVGGLDQPLAVAGDPADDATVWVADGGASQQLRRYGAGGNATAVIGRRGGMAGEPRVSADRLCFQVEAEREQTALAVDARHQVWVVDTCNNRMLRLAPTGELLDLVAYLPHVYAAAVDTARPERVFANYLEFEVDYTRAASAPGAWRLLRNWLPVLPPALRDGNSRNKGFGGFYSVHTLPNARTYALLNVSRRQVLVELAAAGGVRAVRWLPAPVAGQSTYSMYENGDIGWLADAGGRQAAYRLRIEAYDAAGNPVWAAQPAVLASAPQDATAPTFRAGIFTGLEGPRSPVTASGKVIYFNGAVTGPDGFHLGAVALGGTQWAWQASPSGPLDGLGSFQTRSSDANIQYGGNTVLALDRSVVYGYHGEFYTELTQGWVGQANQFMHFYDNGLFVGQFGVPGVGGTTAAPGRSGNAFSPTLVRAAGKVYLYHNDESTWGGVHRWRLRGADDIVEISAAGAIGSALALR